uniref:PA domain-containing protein n=1 Tax=Entomoneis paludosa TaxID=265537 RepID=A0A7S3DXD1_9STRA
MLATAGLLAALLTSNVDAVGTTKLQVQIPQSLKKESGYDHRNALFGMLPYGGSIQQQVYYTENNLCTDSNIDKTKLFPHTGEVETPFILMVDRGECTFVTKVRNAQHFGAAAVLIADDKCQCERANCAPGYPGQMCESVEPMMADDGSGLDIGVPSFLLFKEDADAIKDVLKQDQVVRVEMSFSVPNPDDRVEYDFWTRPGDRNSVSFMSDFKELAVALDKRAFFTPHYAIYDGNAAGCHTADGQNQCMTLCTNHGRYCANDPDDDLYSGVSGADVVTESLRRICIWSHYGSVDGIGLNWWNYVYEFMKRCNDPDYFNSPDCIKDAYSHAGIDGTKIDTCMKDSGGLEDDTNNNKLDTEIRAQREKGVVLVPTSFVNEAQVRGAMSPGNIFEAICSGYSEGTKPDICTQCDKCPNIRDCVVSGGTCGVSPGKQADAAGKVSTHTFASSMFLLICLFSGAGYWYYNRTREEMREQVRGILAEYMPLEDNGDEGSPTNGARGNFMMPRSMGSGMAPQPGMGGGDSGMMHSQDMGFAGGNSGMSHGSSVGGDPMRSSLMSS